MDEEPNVRPASEASEDSPPRSPSPELVVERVDPPDSPDDAVQPDEVQSPPDTRMLNSSSLGVPTNVALQWDQDEYNPRNVLMQSADDHNQADDHACFLLLKAVCRSLCETINLEYGKERSVRVLFLFESLIYPIEPECLIQLYGSLEGRVRERYYEVIARQFGELEEHLESKWVVGVQQGLEAFFPTLRANPNFPQLFALLFHQWLFVGNTPRPSLTKQMSLFLKGSNRLFWMDIETSHDYFLPVYMFLRNKVLLEPSFWNLDCEIFKHLSGIFRLLSKFYFYYEPADDLSIFLSKIQNLLNPVKEEVTVRAHKANPGSQVEGDLQASFSDVVPGKNEVNHSAFLETDELLTHDLIDIFLQVNCRTCNNLRNENVLVRYLTSFQVFEYASLRGRSDALLFTTLQTFSNPGGPLYPPKTVRVAASQALAKCFPQGRWVRLVIKYSFRLLHPILLAQAILTRLFALLLFIRTLLIRCFSGKNRSRRRHTDLPMRDKTLKKTQ